MGKNTMRSVGKFNGKLVWRSKSGILYTQERYGLAKLTNNQVKEFNNLR